MARCGARAKPGGRGRRGISVGTGRGGNRGEQRPGVVKEDAGDGGRAYRWEKEGGKGGSGLAGGGNLK